MLTPTHLCWSGPAELPLVLPWCLLLQKPGCADCSLSHCFSLDDSGLRVILQVSAAFFSFQVLRTFVGCWTFLGLASQAQVR